MFTSIDLMISWIVQADWSLAASASLPVKEEPRSTPPPLTTIPAATPT